MPITWPTAKLEPQRRSKLSRQLFRDTFSVESVLLQLCKERAKLARRRNDIQFLHRIDRNQPSLPRMSGPDGEIHRMFPARREWHRFRPGKREGKSSYELNTEALYKAGRRLRVTNPEAPWVQALNERIANIRRRVLGSEAFNFESPKVLPLEKEKGSHKFRPLAIFPLDDKIIDSLTARYLRRLLDHALLPSCLAFRCGQGSKKPPTTHDALKKIIDLNRRHLKSRLFVAECDIKSFYDCVSHAVAREALEDLVRDAVRKMPGLELHVRAKEIYESYLRSYSFHRNVKSRQLSLLGWRDKKGEFKWPSADLLDFHGTGEPDNVGVPQGGAISCFIANAVLHAADKKLEQLKRKEAMSFSYMRYCDDMILLAKDIDTCTRVFDTYRAVLKSRLLPAHPPASLAKYDRSFWDGKSKAPYGWDKKGESDNVPWIQFVGYQIRFDNLVRIRPSSIRKHRSKIIATTDKLLKILNPGFQRSGGLPSFAPGLRRCNQQIVHRIRQKLISMSVGRVRLGQPFRGPMPMCWAMGVRGLLGRRIVWAQLKALDLHRERQVRRVIKRLKLRKARRAKDSVAKDVLPFYGAPFSYYGQFAQRAGK
jgi:hypothetical protein